MSQCILVFGRSPEPGQVKTRLIPTLGDKGAARLYQHLLHETLRAASRVTDAQIELWCCPNTGLTPACQALADCYNAQLRSQEGKDLGSRMLHALRFALERHQRAILIGSDCPEYTHKYLESALRALHSHDTVLGPALDGGYVLIGSTNIRASVFEDIEWSSAQVMQQTRRQLKASECDWVELKTLRDIDTLEDLRHYPNLVAEFEVGKHLNTAHSNFLNRK